MQQLKFLITLPLFSLSLSLSLWRTLFAGHGQPHPEDGQEGVDHEDPCAGGGTGVLVAQRQAECLKEKNQVLNQTLWCQDTP